MSQELRIYSLSLIIVLLLWVSPVRANYGSGSDCPVLDVPVNLSGNDVWASYDNEGWSSEDYRHLYPYDTNANVEDGSYDGFDYGYPCILTADSGTYYDGANHLWVLDDDLTCEMGYAGGDFRAGDEY